MFKCYGNVTPFTNDMELFGIGITGFLSCGLLALFSLILLAIGHLRKKIDKEIQEIGNQEAVEKEMNLNNAEKININEVKINIPKLQTELEQEKNKKFLTGQLEAQVENPSKLIVRVIEK
ncbi:7062_t:CDS:2 [Dentiscutata erythropus]|uniref:7062_t:CDS:1 n=1 Tax=Dentiscutata erythropus TaxID=1348616 RepID=A0A9N8VCV1_9GLOM|nr:7062_t:CDS:2 [Dentiscutata erythropus]